MPLKKARIVNQTSCDLGIPLDQTVVVGDGANDALMLGQAGLAIAYNAKKKARSSCQCGTWEVTAPSYTPSTRYYG